MTKASQAFTVRPEGEVNMRTSEDGSLVFTSNKPTSVDMNNILSVGIYNVIDIKSYELKQIDNITKHFITFHNGGTVNIEYSNEGGVLNYSARGMITELEHGERIMVKKK
ncbi:Uncharacterised protein [Klebsiella pneumoniae]|uniref:hypothetical protein n=1 Tax=Klebsiella pneumoniae TaxID=573 RepID=UPI000E2BA5C2|nr:hypothetical protein [Klebsiella pneumoniae]SWY00441.1 Uncharacterised protein [Klebsiella pneumoniae]